MEPTILIALIGMIGVIVTAGANYYKIYNDNKSLEKTNAELNLELEDLSLKTVMDLVTTNKIQQIVLDMFKKTKVDRFLILIATNGKTELKYATVIFEMHDSIPEAIYSYGAASRYVKFKFDEHYRDSLRYIEKEGFMNIDVNSLPDNVAIKDIYKMEKIKHSKWMFFKRMPINKDNDRLFFGSAATHSDEPYTNEERIVIRYTRDLINETLFG